MLDAESIINKTSSTKFESFKKVYDEKTGFRALKKMDDFCNNQINLNSGNKVADECRNNELNRITRDEHYVDEDEEEDEDLFDKKENKMKTKFVSKSGTSSE